MQTQILVIEDDELLNSGLCYHLQKRGITPFSAYGIEEAKSLLTQEHFDLILLDVNLPDGNGFDLARETISHSDVPFLFLTAHNLEEEIIQGLRFGADDYIVKPFSVKVLMEKIQTVLRRCSGAQGQKVYTAGSLSVDLENRIVKSRGNVVSLTPTEFEILEVFCRNRDQILTKDILLEKIWDRKENYVNEHTLSLNVSRLRNKIADGEHEYIKTIYGLGYKWVGGRK
nr:response regulator transcription factor [uncultured Schaedlerella sp.]